MSHEMLKLIDRLKSKSPEKALETLNKTTGLTWSRLPVSLVNRGTEIATAK